MKLNLLTRLKQDEGELIAGFGEARLMKKLTGKFVLLGGTAADRIAAKEWCSQFMRDALAACTPAPSPPPRN